jgi:hypothetical protein
MAHVFIPPFWLSAVMPESNKTVFNNNDDDDVPNSALGPWH